MPLPREKASTRTRLLDAAAVIFAQKGFTDTTVAEICDEAGANISAVNYHFGSKEELYRHSWLYAFGNALPHENAPEGTDADTPQEQLHYQITLLVRRIANPENSIFGIMEHEFANPTGLLRDIIAKELAPHQTRFNTHIAALLGEKASAKEVDLCRASIIAQCFHLKKLQRLHETQGEAANFADLDSDTYAEHVYRFSLGGIEAVRRGLA